MVAFLFVLACVALAAGAPKDTRIVGGNDVDISEVPYQLSLELLGVQICGASILSSSVALTSAKCLLGTEIDQLTIRKNATMRGVGGNIIPVKKFIIHENFDGISYDNDIGLLFFEEGSLNQEAAVKIINDGAFYNNKLQVTGWGRLETNGHMANHLQIVEVEEVAYEICHEIYKDHLTNNMICAISEGKDACQGDAGSALVAKTNKGFIQVGIASWGYGCAEPGYAGVYTNVPKLYDWIVKHTNLL